MHTVLGKYQHVSTKLYSPTQKRCKPLLAGLAPCPLPTRSRFNRCAGHPGSLTPSLHLPGLAWGHLGDLEVGPLLAINLLFHPPPAHWSSSSKQPYQDTFQRLLSNRDFNLRPPPFARPYCLSRALSYPSDFPTWLQSHSDENYLCSALIYRLSGCRVSSRAGSHHGVQCSLHRRQHNT